MDANLEESLLQPCQPSEVARRDVALLGAGVSASQLAAAKDSMAALALGAAKLEASTALRDRLLASVARPGRFGQYVDRLARMFDLSMVDAEQLIARVDTPQAYTPFFVEGVEMLEVKTGPRFEGAIAVIAKLAPGARWPDHAHRGEETMFVLAGGFRETNGNEVWRGDELTSGDGSEHAFVALDGEPCITASLVVGFVEFR